MLNRKLGYWETVCKFGHDYFSGTGNVTAHVILTGSLNTEILNKAIFLQYERHPLLRAVINEMNYELFFELSADFENVEITTLTNLEDETSLVEEQMHQKFEIGKALWRVAIAQKKNSDEWHVLATFHHAIADGLSTAHYMHDLLECYKKLCNEHHIELESLPFLESVEQQLEVKNSWDDFLVEKENLKAKLHDPMPYHEFAPIKKRKTKNIYTTFTENELNKLLERCREEKTTINSALNAAMLLTAAKCIKQRKQFTLHSPVNLRKHCQPIIEQVHIGCYISMVTTLHEDIQSTDDFWELARSYRQQLQQNIQVLGFCPADFNIRDFDIVQLIHLFDMPGSTKRKEFSSGFGVSNLGKVHFEQNYGDLNFKSFMFTTNREMGDYAIFINVVTINNEMRLCFCYANPLIEHEWVQRFVQGFMQLIKAQL